MKATWTVLGTRDRRTDGLLKRNAKSGFGIKNAGLCFCWSDWGILYISVGERERLLTVLSCECSFLFLVLVKKHKLTEDC